MNWFYIGLVVIGELVDIGLVVIGELVEFWLNTLINRKCDLANSLAIDEWE